VRCVALFNHRPSVLVQKRHPHTMETKLRKAWEQQKCVSTLGNFQYSPADRGSQLECTMLCSLCHAVLQCAMTPINHKLHAFYLFKHRPLQWAKHKQLLCCAVLCCAVLCCAVLCCAVLATLTCLQQPVSLGMQGTGDRFAKHADESPVSDSWPP